MPYIALFSNFFQSEEKVVAAVKQCPDIVCKNIERFVAPKIAIIVINTDFYRLISTLNIAIENQSWL